MIDAELISIAAAFNAAQAGYLPTPSASANHRQASRSEASGSRRALSAAEQVADSARALSPVRYFLHPTDHNESAEYGSFSSLANPSSTNTSYDYQKEEEYVRAKMKSENGHSRKGSEARRKKKATDGDMPYRPAEDDWANGSDISDVEGEGIVKNGALEGRAATRGQAKEKGEGYLGSGLGIQPRRRLARTDQDESDEDQLGYPGDDRYSPAPSHLSRPGFSRSPTPAQLLRALSPRVSPGPRAVAVRRRQPSSLRTIVTNILHGLAVALRVVTELLIGTIKTLVLKPLEIAKGSSKNIYRQIRQHGWKGLGALLALSLLLRLSNYQSVKSPTRRSDSSSLEQLYHRLDGLEQAFASLSVINSAARDSGDQTSDQSLLDRLARIEASVSRAGHADSSAVAAVANDLASLRSDMSDMASSVRLQSNSILAAEASISAHRHLERDLRAVEKRVDEVEDRVRAALDDGRLRQAIERILPEWMPIKRSRGGRIDVEPVFWAELKKVLAGKDDLDRAIQAGLDSRSGRSMDEQEMEKWGDRLFEKKAAQGLVITRAQFMQAMNNELEDLKYRIDQSRQHNACAVKPSTTVYKNHKGDDITSMLHELVDAAILKYSKDTLATPDYALFTAGARVVPSITSDTLLLKAAPRLGKWFAGMQDVEGRSPATALHPDNSVGSCWPFEGDRGQLGVLLSRRVVVSDITIEHAAKELSPDIKTAPKQIEVVCVTVMTGLTTSGVWWKATQTRPRLKSIFDRIHKNRMSMRVRSPLTGRASSLAGSSDQLLLASVLYDPHAVDPTQTFPIAPAIVELGVDMGIVVFKVESNWGGDLTCLYRVSPVSALKATSDIQGARAR